MCPIFSPLAPSLGKNHEIVAFRSAKVRGRPFEKYERLRARQSRSFAERKATIGEPNLAQPQSAASLPLASYCTRSGLRLFGLHAHFRPRGVYRLKLRLDDPRPRHEPTSPSSQSAAKIQLTSIGTS